MIFDDYRYIRNDIDELTSGSPIYHSILKGIAQGDGRVHSTFKRANITEEIGKKAIEELSHRGIIRVEKPHTVFTSWSENVKVDNKLFFTAPFTRFWFAFVSPVFKGIRDNNYKEAIEKFTNNETEFMQLTFVELVHELLKVMPYEDKIVEISTYWDTNIKLDIFAKTLSGKTVVGSCKYTSAKVNKSELKNLEELCKKSNIKPDIFVIVSKNGFSNELKNLKSENIKLLTLKNFKTLLE